MTERKQLKIPQTVIDKIVTDTDIVTTIGRYLNLKKQGTDYLCLCPFHKEATPSFSVSPAKQFYYCFGCGAGGNALNFLMEYLGKSFISVIQELAEDQGVDLAPYLMMAQTNRLEFKLLPAMEKSAAFFHKELANEKESTQARAYLSGRNISQGAIERFCLGYAGSNAQVVKGLADVEEEMKLGGVLDVGERGTFSLFRNRIIMPVRDVRGRVIGISGRTVEADVKPKYKNSKESALFSRNSALYGLYESMDSFAKGKDRIDCLNVVEGQIDVISQWMLGSPACAAMGSSLSAQQLRLLMRYAKHITFMFDGDAAGIKAMVQVCTLLLEQIVEHDNLFDVVLLPEGEDPSSLINKDPSLYEQAISQRTHWLDALFKYLPEAKDKDSNQGRTEYARRCIELIHDARDPLLRHQALEKASVECGFPVEAMRERLLALPPARSGQAMKGNPAEDAQETMVRLSRMLWDEPALLQNIKQPTLWVEQGDALTALAGQWALDAQQGAFDGQYSDAEAQTMMESPERFEEIELKSRWRVAGAALGRRLTEANIKGLMELLMKDEPEQGTSLALDYINHVTGSCAALGMQALSDKARAATMTDEDRTRFTQLLAIRRDAANRLKG